MLRAYRVTRNGEEIGFLGEGPGPFVSSARSPEPHPMLGHARFTALQLPDELDVAEILAAESSFERVVAVLTEKGFELTELVYDETFLPVSRTPMRSPGFDSGGPGVGGGQW